MYNRIRTAIGFSTVIHQSCLKSILVTLYLNYLLKIKEQKLAHLHYYKKQLLFKQLSNFPKIGDGAQ